MEFTLGLLWRCLLYCGVIAAIIIPRAAISRLRDVYHALGNVIADHLWAVTAVFEQAAGR